MQAQHTHRAMRALAASAVAAVAFALGGTAIAQPMMGGPGGHGGGGGWHGGFDVDPATQGKRIDAMVGWWLADIDATPEQRERIATIMKGAANDLAANRASRGQARRQAMTLLAAPVIDRAQLEKLRVEQMQLADVSSRRMVQAMADAAEVLTPAQRAKIAEKRQQRRGAPPAKPQQ